MSVLVKNASGEQIPAWAVMLVTGAERLTNERVALTVSKIAMPPTVAGVQRLLLNGATPLGITGASRYGQGRVPSQSPDWVACDATVNFGEMWGPSDGSFVLTRSGAGFRAVGEYDAETDRALFSYEDSPQGYFTLTAALTAPSSITGTPTTAEALLYTRYAGGTSLGGQVVTITNRWSNLELDAGKGGLCRWDWTLLEWVIVSTECPED